MPIDNSQISPEAAFVFANLFLTLVQRSIGAVPLGLEDLFIGEAVNDPTKI
jgi:hypothetical protein